MQPSRTWWQRTSNRGSSDNSDAAADELVGVTRRATPRYTLVYRSIDHRVLRGLCVEATKSPLPAKYRKYAPARGFGADVHAIAETVVELQEKRYAADYDPSTRFSTADVQLAVATARWEIATFKKVGRQQRQAFLSCSSFRRDSCAGLQPAGGAICQAQRLRGGCLDGRVGQGATARCRDSA